MTAYPARGYGNSGIVQSVPCKPWSHSPCPTTVGSHTAGARDEDRVGSEVRIRGDQVAQLDSWTSKKPRLAADSDRIGPSVGSQGARPSTVPLQRVACRPTGPGAGFVYRSFGFAVCCAVQWIRTMKNFP